MQEPLAGLAFHGFQNFNRGPYFRSFFKGVVQR